MLFLITYFFLNVLLWHNVLLLRIDTTNSCQFHSKIFIVRPVSAVRPSSVTDNMRGRYYDMSLSKNDEKKIISYKAFWPFGKWKGTYYCLLLNQTMSYWIEEIGMRLIKCKFKWRGRTGRSITRRIC